MHTAVKLLLIDAMLNTVVSVGTWATALSMLP